MEELDQIRTNRLIIRPFTNDDLDSMCRWTIDVDVMRFIGGVLTHDETSERLSRVIAVYERMKPLGPRAISLSAVPHEAIGYCGLGILPHSPEKHIEIFAGLTRSAWGSGFASEACISVMRMGFEKLSLEQVVAAVNPHNDRSLRLVNRLGFGQQGTMPWPEQKEVGVFVLSRDEFLKRF